jgi:hypothetical protein
MEIYLWVEVLVCVLLGGISVVGIIANVEEGETDSALLWFILTVVMAYCIIVSGFQISYIQNTSNIKVKKEKVEYKQKSTDDTKTISKEELKKQLKEELKQELIQDLFGVDSL